MTQTKTYREIQAERDERAASYWDDAFTSAEDDDARSNLAYAYNADN